MQILKAHVAQMLLLYYRNVNFLKMQRREEGEITYINVTKPNSEDGAGAI